MYTRWEIRSLNHHTGDYKISEIDLKKYDTEEDGKPPEKPKLTPKTTPIKTEDYDFPILSYPTTSFDVSMMENVSTLNETKERDSNDIFDVIFFYTPELLVEEGSVPAVNAKIDNGVAYANLAYFNSGIDLRMRKVSAELVTPNASTGPFVESGGATIKVLTQLSTVNDGILDAEMAYADTVGADAVCLFVSNKSPPVGEPDYGYRGIAWINSILSYTEPHFFATVVRQEDAIVHEIAHNMGVSAVLCVMCVCVMCVCVYVCMCYTLIIFIPCIPIHSGGSRLQEPCLRDFNLFYRVLLWLLLRHHGGCKV